MFAIFYAFSCLLRTTLSWAFSTMSETHHEYNTEKIMVSVDRCICWWARSSHKECRHALQLNGFDCLIVAYFSDNDIVWTNIVHGDGTWRHVDHSNTRTKMLRSGTNYPSVKCDLNKSSILIAGLRRRPDFPPVRGIFYFTWSHRNAARILGPNNVHKTDRPRSRMSRIGLGLLQCRRLPVYPNYIRFLKMHMDVATQRTHSLEGVRCQQTNFSDA